MAKRIKTSKAKIYTARFNPVTSSEDKEALDIIERLEKQGFNFHQIAVDAILRADGKTPEMFQKQATDIVSVLQSMLSDFAQEILGEIRKGNWTSDNPEETMGSGSQFADTFAKKFLERQQRATGDDK